MVHGVSTVCSKQAACFSAGSLATKYLTNIQFFQGFKSCKVLIPNKTSKLLLWKLAYGTLHTLDSEMHSKNILEYFS